MNIKWKLTSRVKVFEGCSDIGLDGARSWEDKNKFHILAGDFIYETECESDWTVVLLMLSSVVMGITIKSKHDRLGIIAKDHPLIKIETPMTLTEIMDRNYGKRLT